MTLFGCALPQDGAVPDEREVCRVSDKAGVRLPSLMCSHRYTVCVSLPLDLPLTHSLCKTPPCLLESSLLASATTATRTSLECWHRYWCAAATCCLNTLLSTMPINVTLVCFYCSDWPRLLHNQLACQPSRRGHHWPHVQGLHACASRLHLGNTNAAHNSSALPCPWLLTVPLAALPGCRAWLCLVD